MHNRRETGSTFQYTPVFRSILELEKLILKYTKVQFYPKDLKIDRPKCIQYFEMLNVKYGIWISQNCEDMKSIVFCISQI